MKKKINASDFLNKIEKLAKSRIAKDEVVSLDQFREMKKRRDPKMILIIEDDATMQTALQRIFEPEGYLIKSATDALGMSQILNEHTPDLIILDVGLPWINGLELASLFQEHKEFRLIPIVFISGLTQNHEIEKAYEIGAKDFFRKPFDIEKLKSRIRELLTDNQSEAV